MTDPYLDLDAGVLRNRLGITDADELARAEAGMLARLVQPLPHPPPQRDASENS